MAEQWRTIAGYEGYYEVSDAGNVRSLTRKDCRNRPRTGRMCKPIMTHDGYLKVSLNKDGKERRFYVHRLVAMHFVGNPHNFSCVNHLNEKKTDNRAVNLEWCTREYNNNYGTRNERIAHFQSTQTAMLDKKTGEVLRVFGSAHEAALAIGGDESSICKVRRGERKSAYGYRWEVI